MDKYQLKITANELSIRPYFGYLPKIRLFVLLAVVIFGGLPFVQTLLTMDVVRIVYAIGGMFLFYAGYDYLFHANVKFLFDKNTRCVYRANGKLFKKQIMAFDELTILTTSEHGLTAYALGRKRNQFVKNYAISDLFSNSKKDQAREAAYTEQVLAPILAFIK